MSKKIICLLLLLLNLNTVYGESRILSVKKPVRTHAYHRNHNYYNPRVSGSDLSALEKYTMNRTYTREHPVQRLERLEELAFGAVQYGDLETRYKNAESAILARPNYSNTKHSILKNVTNYFAGQPTGISPSVIPGLSNGYSYENVYNTLPQNYYTQTYSPYGSQRYDSYSNGIWGHGYRNSDSSIGSGSSIRILP